MLALTTLQLEPNGDVGACFKMPPIGNIKSTPIREIWQRRPRWWEEGCCRVLNCAAAGGQAALVP